MEREMTLKEKGKRCAEFFFKLKEALGDKYEVVISGRETDFRPFLGGTDWYLIPTGTKNDISYYGKPSKSIRASNHWSWYETLNKCKNPGYIQCLNKDVPRPKKRPAPGEKSKSILAIQVGMYGKDGVYHCVYGEKFNHKTKEWEWIEQDPEYVAISLLY